MGGLMRQLSCSAVGRYYAKICTDQALNGAVQIAWQAMFSSFPIILGLLSILGLILRDPTQRQWLAHIVASQFPSQLGDILGFIDDTRELSGLLGAASVVGLVWSGYWLFQTMEFVFNHFYGAPPRGLRQQIVMSVAMMGLYAALTSVSVLASVTSTFLMWISEHAARFGLSMFDPFAGWVLALGSAVSMFAIIYWVIPNRPLVFADVLPGALLAGVLFVLLNQAFPLYFSILGGSYAAYKTLGLFLVLMTWFYCLAVILVLGVELNAFLGGHQGAAVAEVAAMQVLLATPSETVGHNARAGDAVRPRPIPTRRRKLPSGTTYAGEKARVK